MNALERIAAYPSLFKKHSNIVYIVYLKGRLIDKKDLKTEPK